MVSLKPQIPWWSKLAIKLILARLPLDYGAWRRLPIFKHGLMAQPEYAYCVFNKHFGAVDLPPGFVSLELGPGDSLFSALISRSMGGSATYLVDTGRYAIATLENYHLMADFLVSKGVSAPDLDHAKSLEELLETVSAKYLTNGVESLATIPSNSVDFIWSNAVLEHIRRRDFRDTMKELRRILKPGGICSHEIDLRDHLGGGLNNLRFPSSWWEQDWVANSGFYTNRMRHSEILDMFTEAGFKLQEHTILETWRTIPIAQKQMALEFQGFSEEDLSVAVFSVILEPV